MKLTSADYQLPVYFAQEPVKEFGTGVNKPVLMRCVSKKNGKRENIVVKLKDGERMKMADAHARELMAAWLAREMNILVPDPCVVEIAPELIEASKGTEFYGRLGRSVGYNYGTKNLENMPTPHQTDEFNRSQIIDGQRICIFDLMIINPDRTNDKVNLLTDGDRMYAIDHELAFFDILFSLKKRSEPWKLNEGDVKMLNNGFLKPIISGKKFKTEIFISDINMITQGFWKKAASLIPNEWNWEYWQEIENFIMQIVKNSDEFVKNVNRALL